MTTLRVTVTDVRAQPIAGAKVFLPDLNQRRLVSDLISRDVVASASPVRGSDGMAAVAYMETGKEGRVERQIGVHRTDGDGPPWVEAALRF